MTLRSLVPSTVLALALALVPGAGRAEPLDELRACMASNVPTRSSAMTLRLDSRGRAGGEFVHEGRVYWSRSAEGVSRTLICLTSPRDVRGLGYLVHESGSDSTVWVYLPEEERVLRLDPRSATRRGRIARTAVSYEDLQYLPVNLARAESLEVADAKLDERAVSVVRLASASGPEPLYSRVVSYVDRESCVPLKLEFWTAEDEMRKVVTADPAALERREIWLARSMRVRDQKQEVETDVIVEEIEIDGDLPERMFTPEYLQRGRCR